MNRKNTSLRSNLVLSTVLVALAASFSFACGAPPEGAVDPVEQSAAPQADPSATPAASSHVVEHAPKLPDGYANVETPDNTGALTPAPAAHPGRAQ